MIHSLRLKGVRCEEYSVKLNTLTTPKKSIREDQLGRPRKKRGIIIFISKHTIYSF